jgi:hypothetical protein
MDIKRHFLTYMAILVGLCACSPILRAHTNESDGGPIKISTISDTTNKHRLR